MKNRIEEHESIARKTTRTRANKRADKKFPFMILDCNLAYIAFDENDVRIWLEDNLTGTYLSFSDVIQFELKEDAVLFKMVWG